MDDDGTLVKTRRKPARARWIRVALAVIGVYLLIAYLVAPLAWETLFAVRPSLDNNPRVTRTSDGHPGDPLNVALIGTEQQLQAAMKAAGWVPAAALGLRSDLVIAKDTVLSRPDENAPVSNLFLFGRKEDLAYEKPVGHSPRQRNHVRFWKVEEADAQGRPIWIGSASYDERVGFSHTTGQITHHIATQVDQERDRLFEDLGQARALDDQYAVSGFHRQLEGRNGGGDRWQTDGTLRVGVLVQP